MAISQHISHVAVYTLAALAAQDAPQTAIAQSLRIDAPPTVVGLSAPQLSAPQQSIHTTAASPHAKVAPPEVAAASSGEWATSPAELVESVEVLSTPAIAPAPLPQPLTAIAPPEALDRAIAPQVTQTAPLWRPLAAPSVAIAPPDPLFEEPIGLEASTPLFDPWIDAEELSLLDQEWSPFQDELWNLLAESPMDAPAGDWG
ncbi:MAG: hypothetical protein SNJ57_11205 [Cyanobacteriota bacterium]